MSEPAARQTSLTELQHQVDYARSRVALYRRRLYVGGGDPRRLAELERELDGAQLRLGRAAARPDEPAQARSAGSP